MMKIRVRDCQFELHPSDNDDLGAVLSVYQQCEDFLALGPIPTASLEMVLKDIKVSRDHGGQFCGIFTDKGEMIGIVDYIPNNFEGEPHIAFLSLLMICKPYRKQGVGKVVVDEVENEIRKGSQVRTILSAVQVNNPQAVQFWRRNGYKIISGPELLPDQTMVFGLRKDFRT
jgi:ribosomal protein S18 acetylase RimI-like enzyme